MAQRTLSPPVARERWYPMSFEEFVDWVPGEGQAEWVDGEGIAYVSTSTRHGLFVDFLAELLRRFVSMSGLGRVYTSQILLRLPSRPSGRMPDVFVIGLDRLDHVHDQWVDSPVLFAAELISKESVERDLVEKPAEHEAAGTAEYLAVDAELDGERFLYLRLAVDGRLEPVEPDDQGRYHSLALPGFWIDPRWFRLETPPDVDLILMQIAPEAYAAWMMAKIQVGRDETGQS